MKKHIVSLILLLLAIYSSGQELFDSGLGTFNQTFSRRNSVQFDLGGPGLIYSFNYERMLINGRRKKTAIQIGASYYPPNSGIRDIWIPIGVNELFSRSEHHLEVGLGWIIIREASRDSENEVVDWFWSTMMFARLGYRYQRPDGKFIFRAAFTPFFEFEGTREIHPSGGVSIGYSF